jgi:citrate synthase
MVSVNPDLSYTENFLRMVFNSEGEESLITPLMARVLDVLFILHADHELNCGTATVRTITSSHGKRSWRGTIAALVGGIEALAGDLHGGANEAVIDMLIEMAKNNESVPAFVERVKNKERLLSGFGHRVYKSYDPRARIVKSLADEMLNRDSLDLLFGKALELEEFALGSDYFKQRNLYPNVDFYSGLLYHKLGFEKQFFTVLFAAARIAGWLAHLEEYAIQPSKKIVRPRQVYTGYTKRSYISVADR